jgi:hypothetical protein
MRARVAIVRGELAPLRDTKASPAFTRRCARRVPGARCACTHRSYALTRPSQLLDRVRPHQRGAAAPMNAGDRHSLAVLLGVEPDAVDPRRRARRKPSPDPPLVGRCSTSILGAVRCWSATARASAARSAWTSGLGAGTPMAHRTRGAARRAAFCIIDGPTRGRPGPAPGSAASCAGSPRARACGVGSRRISCAMRTRSSWPREGRPAQHHPAPTRPRQSRHNVD